MSDSNVASYTPPLSRSRSVSLVGLAEQERPQFMSSCEQREVENMTWFTKHFVYPVKKMNREQPKVCTDGDVVVLLMVKKKEKWR
jgi:hypothetical protein